MPPFAYEPLSFDYNKIQSFQLRKKTNKTRIGSRFSRSPDYRRDRCRFLFLTGRPSHTPNSNLKL